MEGLGVGITQLWLKNLNWKKPIEKHKETLLIEYA